MAHQGDYILQRVMGQVELLESDVNLVHRLLKNHGAEATGWQAYVLFTAQCPSAMGLATADLGAHEQVETYDALGEVTTYSLDLQPRYAASVGRACIPDLDSKCPYPMGWTPPAAVALLQASPATKWHPNIGRMLNKEFGAADSYASTRS